MKALQILVIGNGMVGHHYVETLAASKLPVEITVIGGEPRPAYDRVHLSEYFAGRKPEELALTTREHYKQLGVVAHFGDAVISINRKDKNVITESGRCFHYDKLILATGSYPFVPPINGSDLPECLVYRTIDDLGMIQAQSKTAKVGVVIGGGLLGLEAANALKNLGMQTHVVEFAPGLMGVQLDDNGSKMLRRKIEALDVQVHTKKATKSIKKGSNTRLLMSFADGETLATDMIVFSAGIRPQDKIAGEAGLALGERGGIVIDEHCKTNDENIFAIGECALFNNQIFGLVAPGYRMAEAAISQLTSDPYQFMGADMSTKLKLLGVDVGSIGDTHGKTLNSISYVFSDEREGIYKRLVVSEDSSTLLGAVLVGDCAEYDMLLQYYLNGIDLPAAPETLILPEMAGGVPALGAASLPDSAVICSCLNVSKGAVITAIDSGCGSFNEIKTHTGASTGCGGCAALLKNVVDHELSSRGMEVDTSICEHFKYTRQELFHLINVESIKNFAQLLQKYGSGLGCDICKPAVASILASLWNKHILDEHYVELQDTNDNFLANMQKDGTYSVVPRIAGGEITPDKLIVLGNVAKKYHLYSKIHGGQRIDLFGAHLEQLPDIWKELVAAGFETGHAYVKALRTVKSCVGNTWCRYGVKDSINMALYIENRYKGLRSPHKLKSAVSGCTRECAEAQSKDFGVIATEKGWNLYVCGNGGMKPRHADLFATDLDDKTLIKYIDRFLMFYIRTADRLQRTSVWLDNLEGGLDYLKEIIIDDKLDLAEELETQMEKISGSYQCEWKTTVENPLKLKRFRRFANSTQADDTIVFVEERGQPRPATEVERSKIFAKSA